MASIDHYSSKVLQLSYAIGRPKYSTLGRVAGRIGQPGRRGGQRCVRATEAVTRSIESIT